jgi:nicotinamide-nucleotide amidase
MSATTQETLAARLGAALVARGWRAATAESCTGGLVAGAITAIAGSSDWFDRGFVTYSNAAKVELLGVSEAVLAASGAVSEPVAAAMAEGALRRSGADVAVAITGIAGPGGGRPGKPVGTVCFAWAVRGGATRSQTRHLAGDRAGVRAEAVAVALAGLAALAGGNVAPSNT